jgi:hypothetical protein
MGAAGKEDPPAARPTYRLRASVRRTCAPTTMEPFFCGPIDRGWFEGTETIDGKSVKATKQE